MGTVNLQQLRLDHPSPGVANNDLFLQSVTSTGEGVAITVVELRNAMVILSKLLTVSYTEWTAGTYPANTLRTHGGKLAVSRVNDNSEEPGETTDDNWVIFATPGEFSEFILSLAQPYP